MKARAHRSPGWLAPLMLWSAACTSTPENGPWTAVDDDLAARLQVALETAREEQAIPGLAMAVAFPKTRQRWVATTGYRDLEGAVPWTPEDESRIGSVTKTFTAALVLQLAEEDVLSLDDPIETWVPGWYAGPTLRHLLEHSSGIASYNYVGSFDESAAWTPTELVAWAYSQAPDLQFEPGTRFDYSNTNYVLLGLTIEAATGQTYRDACQTRAFDPLALNTMRVAETGDASPTLVRSYEGMPPVDVSNTVDPSFGWAAGSMVATPADLSLWVAALYGGTFLEAETLADMTTPNGTTAPDEEDYGLGTTIQNGDENYTLVGHTGGIAGYLTSAFYLEEEDVALVVMSNLHDTDLNLAASHAWAVVLGVE